MTLLDVGCGAGGHLFYFAKLGYRCTGVDISSSMLAIARKKLSILQPKPTLRRTDARSLRLKKQFDVVVSLFHVVSYMTTLQDARRFLQALRTHARPGGLVVFDCWWGPGVLADAPKTQYKKVTTRGETLHKIKIPILHRNAHTVDVYHHVFVQAANGRAPIHRMEKHTLRYFFYPEVVTLLEEVGLSLLAWGTLTPTGIRPLKGNAWGATFVCQTREAKEH